MQNKSLKIIFIIFLILVFIIIAETVIIHKAFPLNQQRPITATFSMYVLSMHSFFNKNKQSQPHIFILADENGKPVSKTKYSTIFAIKDGFYRVIKNNKKGIIDFNGDVIVPTKFDEVNIIDNYFVARRENSDKYHIYNKNKNFKIVLKSEDAFRPVVINDNYFVVKQNGKIIVFDRKRKPVINEELGELFIAQYRNATEQIHDKLVFRIKKDEKWGLVSIDNEYIIEPEYDEIQTRQIEENQDGIYVKKLGKWGKVNFENEILVDFIYDVEPQIINSDIYIVPIEKEKKNYTAKPPLTEEEKLDLKLKEIEERKKKAEEERLKNIKKVDGDLHIVSVYEGKERYNENRGLKEHEPANITVKVEIKNKPITLLLTSYEAVSWEIEPVLGAKIKKIYFMGYYDSEVKAPKGIKIEKLDKRNYITDEKAEQVKDLFDKEPSSLQYKYRNDYFFVNGFDGVKKDKKEFITHSSTNADVKLMCRNYTDCVISKNGLEAGYANIGASSVAYTNKYYNKGKYYFEAQLIALSKDLSWMNVGIMSNDPKRHCSFGHMDEEDSCYSYGVINNGIYKKLTNNDIIGYAVDFDNGKIYVSLNGIWHENCMPDKEKTIYTFKNDGREYSAAVEAGRGVKWQLNFGSKKFRYPIPKGFSPYDEYSANKKKINQNK